MGAVALIIILLIIGFVGLLIFAPIQENPVSQQTTGLTTQKIISAGVDVDSFCEEKLPNGFTNVVLDFDDVLSSGMCFPIENLEIFSCSQKKLIDGSIKEICIADIFLSDRSGVFNGIQTDSNGLAFIELECEIGNKWAECEQNKKFPLLSFLP